MRKINVNANPVCNAGIQHLLLNILIDLSDSMACSTEALKRGIQELEAALKENNRARTAIEISVITFNDTVNATPYASVSAFECPNLTTSGCTSLHEALEVSVQIDQVRKAYLRDSGCGLFRSWDVILTDGMPTDEDNGRIKMYREAQRRGSKLVYPVRIGEYADKEFLSTLSIAGNVITASRENFSNAFQWLSDSLTHVTESRPGEEVYIPNPNDSKYGGIKFEQIPVRV